MITRSTHWFMDEIDSGHIFAQAAPVPRGVFMVEPVNFHISRETAFDNNYMAAGAEVDPDRALEQYIELVSKIRETGIQVKSFPGDPNTPDDVFPNNVFATIPNRLIIGRMYHPQRQLETQRPDIRRYFDSLGYETVDLSGTDCVAELTGVMVLDRARRLGFCGMSSRVNSKGVEAMHNAFDLRCTLQFDLKPSEYHTNVVMAVLAGRALVIHPGSFVDAKVPRTIASLYGTRVLYLDEEEKNAFAANCIALTPNDLFMSRHAADSLKPDSRSALESWGFRIHASEIDEIEKAGGSLRCMVAEIF